MVRVIDVSVHQGRIDWQAVKDSGVQGAWIKVGGADGGLYWDSRANENLAGAEAVGLPHGTYYFCVPDADPRRQAQHAVICGHGRGRMLPAADIEVNPHGLGRDEIDLWAGAFCDEVARQVGRESAIYCGMATVGFSRHAPSHCALWIANYGTNRPGTVPPNFRPALPPAWSDWDAWQYNSVTRVPGIPGNTVDQNVVTDAFWARMTETTTPEPEEDDDMIETYLLITEPGSKWFVEVGGPPGHQGVYKALSSDQFVRPMTPEEVAGHQGIRDWIVATGAKSGLREPGEVPDWMFYDRTLLPRVWTAGDTTVVEATVALTPEQLAELAEMAGWAVAEELRRRLEA
jgi:GH25 family lysozyme M1 (1,4-beta-N-acetylmuramidase)